MLKDQLFNLIELKSMIAIANHYSSYLLESGNFKMSLKRFKLQIILFISLISETS